MTTHYPSTYHVSNDYFLTILIYRKAIKATIVLLPLLGVANLVWLIPLPEVSEPKAWIVTYNYGFLFLDAFQGLFVGLLYCFLNTEVRILNPYVHDVFLRYCVSELLFIR